jgi:hypothetical protein
LDCHASAAQYLDSTFRNLPNWGILAITTTDDAVYSNAEIALKNYGGVVTRTFYSKELAVRLIVAAVARFVQCSRTFDRGIYLHGVPCIQFMGMAGLLRLSRASARTLCSSCHVQFLLIPLVPEFSFKF